MRHGVSRWNRAERFQGQQCGGLSPAGHEQAAHVAAELADAYPDAGVVTSDLRRARETAASLATALGRMSRSDTHLRERGFGAWEGRAQVDVMVAEPDRWARWRAGEDVIAEVGGESSIEFHERVRAVLCGLLDDRTGPATTIAVTHAGPIWYGVHQLFGLPLGALGSVANASITEITVGLVAAGERQRDGLVLDRWNDVGHIPHALRQRTPTPR